MSHYIFTEESRLRMVFGSFRVPRALLPWTDSRFKIEATLGFGTTASGLLAIRGTFLGRFRFDSSETYIAPMFRGDHYMTLKLSNGYAFQLNKEGMLQKLKALQRLSSDTSLSLLVDTSSVSVRLPHYLYHQGIETDGDHLHLVTYETARNRHPIHMS